MGFFKKMFSKLSESSNDNSEKETDANESPQNDSTTNSVSSPEAIKNKGKEEANVSVMTEDQQVSTQENSQKKENMPTPEKAVGLVENAPAQDSPKSSQPESHEEDVLNISDLEKLKREAWEKVRQARSENDPRESEYYNRYREFQRAVKNGKDLTANEAEKLLGKIFVSDAKEIVLEPNKFSESEYVVLPKSVEKIGDDAFNECTQLISIDLPPNLTEIGNCAFYGCTGLGMIDMSQCASLERIGKFAFYGCSQLKRIVLPQNLKEIGDSVFYGCCELESLDISHCTSLKKIEDSAFYECTKLKSIVLPPHLSVIGDYAFSKCSELETVDMSHCTSLEVIGDCAFNDCAKLKYVVLPSSLREIGPNAFLSSSGDVDMTHCAQLVKIGGCAFAHTNIRSIAFPDSVEELGEATVNGCDHLKSITLPKNLKNLGWIGERCPMLKSIDMSHCTELKEIYSSIGNFESVRQLAFPNGVETIEVDRLLDWPRQAITIYLPPTLRAIDINNIIIDRLYCYSPCLESLDILLKTSTFFVKPEYLEHYCQQAEAEELDCDIEPMPDDKLYFYDD